MATKVTKVHELWQRWRARGTAAPHLDLGRRGEDIAVRELQREGYEILERGYRCRLGEIDIVAREGQVLAVVEVKTRRRDDLRRPVDAVGPRKKRKIVQLARAYLALRRNRAYLGVPVRFDVVGVVLDGRGAPRVELLRGAFDASSFDNSHSTW